MGGAQFWRIALQSLTPDLYTQNGWLDPCDTILYVTTDGTEPSEHNFAYKGTTPLKVYPL